MKCKQRNDYGCYGPINRWTNGRWVYGAFYSRKRLREMCEEKAAKESAHAN